MPHRNRPRSTLAARVVMALALATAVPATFAAQPAPAYGIRVRAACLLTNAATTRVLADLSCESAMNCWSEPEAMSLLDAASDEGVAAAPGELLYVDGGGSVLAEPPMQGTIRAIWAATLEQPPAPRRLQLAVDGVAATAPFEPAADCAALPPAAVKRLSGG
ncbi:hypothetical protein MNR01_08425 [Lysobacter sp. S4-A87]|uniref:hypothetical protein n=1 Tax=Lysobacter sp. S4-A87 TaxID=2925843 RepID=UPI001F53C1C4|nr:hypothetical protein [Lysobacter sp. S4-A87]UNK51002.1 hypothetical protein MNR01_08425 [Lysobacter sp. S4-A87]